MWHGLLGLELVACGYGALAPRWRGMLLASCEIGEILRREGDRPGGQVLRHCGHVGNHMYLACTSDRPLVYLEDWARVLWLHNLVDVTLCKPSVGSSTDVLASPDD
jgi:hypothetical protein